MFGKIALFFSLFILLYIIPPGGFSAWSFESGVRWLYLFLISFLIFNISYPFIFRLAWKINAIDVPDSRKVHLKPVPRIGGLGVYLAFIFTIIRNFQFSSEIISILIGSSVIFIVGFIDDVKGLSAKSRLFFQVLSACIVVAGGVKITYTLGWGLYGQVISWIVSVLWIVGIINAFNFMDGIDGLAASMGLVISVIFLIITVNTEQYKVMFITASLCGSVFGFLIYNWSPAKIFLGDGGSTLIGFILACLGIYGSYSSDNPFISLSVPIIILSIPIFDIIYITVSRIKNGLVRNITEWLEYTGKDHFHHRLLSVGFSVKSAVVFISLLNLILGSIAAGVVVKDEFVETVLSFFEVFLIFIIIVIVMVTARNKIDGVKEI
ncbi:MAG: MraY family glycosyltransferase [Elusimicrobiales bacterium]|nr:MraY family glycosyltransferase [Elusimicrobiales bacterium]